MLILDEPTVGLDPTQIREVRHLIRELAGRHTILLSSHILSEIEQTCDRVLMIAGGRIREAGTVEELRTRAARAARYRVEISDATASIRLRDLDDVADVEVLPDGTGWHRVTVTARTDAPDLRECIATTLREAGVSVRELSRDAPSLEQLFISVIGALPDVGESRRKREKRS